MNVNDNVTAVHFEIDGSRAQDLHELWVEIEETLSIPPHFGRNRDAFIDVLRDLGADFAVTHLSVNHCSQLLRSSTVDQRFFFSAVGQVVSERSGLSHGRLVVHLS